MKTVRLIRGRDEWLLKYDGRRRTVTVEGPAPESEQVHRWLVTPRRLVNPKGSMVVESPIRTWAYIRQAVDVDLYARFMMRAHF